MPLAEDDIITLTVDGRKDNQVVLNVFHYRCASAPSAGTPANNIQDLINHVWDDPNGTWFGAWLNCMPDDYTLRAVRGQRVAPTRTAYVEVLIQTVGNIVALQTQTANLAWVFIRQSETAGRWAQAPTHMLMPATSWYTNGELNVTGSAEQADLLALVDDVQTVAGGGVYEPVIYNPGRVPNFVRVSHATKKPEVRVMRRRTVGLGI